MINTKRIYTLATVNGISHKDVQEYICWEWGLTSTKDLTDEQYKSLITYLDKGEKQVADKVFAKGVWAKEPRQGQPDFVIGSMSIKSQDFVAFLNEHTNEKGYCNLDILKGKEGKFNVVLNEWKPKENF